MRQKSPRLLGSGQPRPKLPNHQQLRRRRLRIMRLEIHRCAFPTAIRMSPKSSGLDIPQVVGTRPRALILPPSVRKGGYRDHTKLVPHGRIRFYPPGTQRNLVSSNQCSVQIKGCRKHRGGQTLVRCLFGEPHMEVLPTGTAARPPPCDPYAPP